MKLNNFFKLIISLIVSSLAGLIGISFITPASTIWYASLTKPPLTPSNAVFIIVWISLYVLMGIAAFLIWKQGLEHKKVKAALLIFIFQLIANAFWPMIFFGAHNLGLAFLEIISLWSAVLASILIFYEILPKAAYLLLPYILWVSFFIYLTYFLWHPLSPKAVPTNQNTLVSTSSTLISSSDAKTTINNIDSNPANQSSNLANPASRNCLQQGGSLIIKKDGAGGEFGLCDFGSGQACEEWALFRDNCPLGGVKTTGFDTEAQKYCAWLGGQTLAVPDAVCTFKNGQKCLVTDLYNEKCFPNK